MSAPLVLVASDEQRELARSVLGLVTRESPIQRLRTLRDERDPLGHSPDLWRRFAELGLLGLTIPEEHGGSGLGCFELALALEACGRQLVPEPLVATLALAVPALIAGASPELAAEVLPRVASGDLVLTLADREAGDRRGTGAVTATATAEADDVVIDGHARHVLHGQGADHFLMPARRANGALSLFLVARTAPGVSVTPQFRIDSTSAADLVLRGVRVPRRHELPGGEVLLERARDLGRVALAAEALGGAQRAFELLVAYLGTREQFGVKIGTFQALQHRAARAFADLELARSTVLAAARVADQDPAALPAYASLAKAQMAEAFTLVAAECVQMHGGIGVTDECDAGFYLKRARVFDATLGDAAFHHERWATLSGY